MPPLSKIIIADTSCFILLSKIGELQILHLLFHTVVTTPEIVQEFGQPLPIWVKVEGLSDKKYQTLLELEVDKGEASAIALATEMENSLLILDDWQARKLAEKLNLDYTGTLGVIVKAKQTGAITSVKPIIEKIRRTNFRFNEEIFREVLKAAGEF